MASQNNLSFLPDGYFENKAQRRANAICAVLFVIVIAGMWTAFTLSEKATRNVDAEDAKTDLAYVNEAKRIVQTNQMRERQNRMAHQAELTASLLEKVPRSYILAEITNCMPAGVSLLDLNLDSKERAKPTNNAPAKTAYEMQKAAKENKTAAPVAAAPPEPKIYDVNLKLVGVALNDVQVAQFLKNLNSSRLLRDVNLLESAEYTQGTDKLRKFQIELALERNVEVKPQTQPATTVELEK
jgi:hypothetical protein